MAAVWVEGICFSSAPSGIIAPGKAQPFLYTQCQPILARSLIPCQDTPAVKLSYRARVRAPAPLVALMSAVRTGAEFAGLFNRPSWVSEAGRQPNFRGLVLGCIDTDFYK